RLRRLGLPVLLIGGDRDPSLAPMKVMQQKVRGSKLVVLSPASHFGNRDQPEAWNRTVLDFLARCDRRTRGESPMDHPRVLVGDDAADVGEVRRDAPSSWGCDGTH